MAQQRVQGRHVMEDHQSVLVLLPTRELAKQVYAEFEVYGGSLNLTGCCLYGGAPYRSQETSLKRGVDIVIGTPGYIKDHIERGNLNFSSLKFLVLDEADEMLKMGFVDDVELILGTLMDILSSFSIALCTYLCSNLRLMNSHGLIFNFTLQ
ncbi:hypothetical protein GIB67_036794, partial [Kingdonia uniflora]